MADALISVVIEQLALPLGDKLKKEIKLVLGAPEDVRKLQGTFKKISHVLDDVEKRHIQNVLYNMERRENREAAESSWLERLKDVSYQTEEVLDEWHTELRKLEVVAAPDDVHAADKGKKTKAWACFMPPCSRFKKVTFHHKIGSKILELKQQLDLLVTEKDKYEFRKSSREEEKHVQLEEDERRTISEITSNLYGRDAEKRKLINMLLAESSQVVPVISIIGMGGIGKTTLAQYIFNDDKVKNHFQKKMWVCVSEPFDRIRIAKAIIEAAEGVVLNVNEWQAWHTQLRQCLEGMRFLLVLDDVWIENQQIWKELKCALDHGQKGSKILVTTRNVSVADTVGTSDEGKHILGKLSDDECWSLFEHLAFVKKEESDHQLLKDVGRKISNKCKGVPLYANSLGSSMARKRRLEDWEEVLTSDIWNLPNVNKYILAPLLLSYNALPSYLKRCFTYCAVFPKDTVIKKDILIKLWMAEGCLGSSQEEKLESIGEKYFDELVRRSFFQELKLDKYDDVSSCKMHDLLHDLATFLSNNECLTAEAKGIELNNPKLRHLCVQRSIDQMDGSLNSIWRLKTLRTLLARGYGKASLEDWVQMSNLTCFRTLDLSLGSKGVLPALLLSYNALPSHLKRCFTYCAVFPKDTEIYKDTLIQMWMAEGCLKSTESSELERIGEKYFNELVMRSFFRELKLDQYGDIRSCKMYGLLHDLATFLGNNECLAAESKGIKLNNTRLRYLCIHRSSAEMKGSLNSIWRLKTLRTLLAKSNYRDSTLQDWEKLIHLTCLRTLDLSNAFISELPKEVERLIHLRYLNLSWTKIKELPETITNLINLQTLDLNGCSSLGGLPKSFGKLVSLRHLDILGCSLIKGLPRGIGKLRELRTLSNFIVSEEGCDLGELKDLNNLCGSFTINIRDIRGIGDEAQGVMSNKKYLSDLILSFSSESEELLELLEPHSDLKELKILSYSGSKFPSWMVFLGTKFTMLRRLEIGGCSKLKVLPALGELQFLEYLELNNLESVAPMGVEVLGLSGDAVGVSDKMSAFPKLKELMIRRMNSWEEWVIHTRSTNITLMPCLQTLNLGNCPMLKSLPWQLLSSSSLRTLRIDDCPNLVVSCLPLFLEELYLQEDAGSLSKSLPVESGLHTNLKYLEISKSPHPTLPEGVSQLTALQTLEIRRSPTLAARCKKGEGEEWNIICHIPNIEIRDDYLSVR